MGVGKHIDNEIKNKWLKWISDRGLKVSCFQSSAQAKRSLFKAKTIVEPKLDVNSTSNANLKNTPTIIITHHSFSYDQANH